MPRGCRLYGWSFVRDERPEKFPAIRVQGYSAIKKSAWVTSEVKTIHVFGGGKALKALTVTGRYYWLERKDEKLTHGWSSLGRTESTNTEASQEWLPISRDEFIVRRHLFGNLYSSSTSRLSVVDPPSFTASANVEAARTL